MALVCVDKDGSEWIFDVKPHRDNYYPSWVYSYYIPRERVAIELPSGSIRKLTGRELTFEDEPVELKDE